MSEFFTIYGIFLAKIITIMLILLITFAGLISVASWGKSKSKEKLEIVEINKRHNEFKELMYKKILTKKEYKILEKTKDKENEELKSRTFIIDFQGDIKASAVDSLREAITAILMIADPKDEVIINLESTGGTIHGYGLAASQLRRIRDKKIYLTVIIDKVAASGGYMMACVADKIIAAPFAIVGSIGVIAQLPNFHRLLRKHDIDYEQIMAGEYKRTLTLFGENTKEGREKMLQEVNEAHQLFQSFISEHRPMLNIASLATGETWYGLRAKELGLIDDISTSDEYLTKAREKNKVFQIKYNIKKNMLDRFMMSMQKNIFR